MADGTGRARRSDLYVTADAAPMWRGDKGFMKLREKPLSADEADRIVKSLLNDKQAQEFARTGEFNNGVRSSMAWAVSASTFSVNASVRASLRASRFSAKIPTG